MDIAELVGGRKKEKKKKYNLKSSSGREKYILKKFKPQNMN